MCTPCYKLTTAIHLNTKIIKFVGGLIVSVKLDLIISIDQPGMFSKLEALKLPWKPSY